MAQKAAGWKTTARTNHFYADYEKGWTPGEGAWFDQAAADAAVRFIETHIRFTKGEWAGRPFKLEPWQEFDIVRPLFGWKRADGTRWYRRAYVWIPRKNGKTELAAAIALLLMLGDAEPGAEIYVIAADEHQAGRCFLQATSMVAWDEYLTQHLDTFKTSIWCPAIMGTFKPLSGRPQGKHGLNANGIIGDELHEWRSGDLYTFVSQSSGARRQPLEFLISTAGKKDGYGYEAWQDCDRIIEGEIDAPHTLVVIYAADPEDDWTKEETWRKANPNYGISVKAANLAEEVAEAKSNPRKEADFKRYKLNLWTEQAVRWINVEKWDENGHFKGDPLKNNRWRKFEDELAGRECWGGLDLSSTTDLTAWLLFFAPTDDDPLYKIVPRFFVPKDNIALRSRRDKVAYDRWAKSGVIIETPGDVVDYDFVKKQVREDSQRFNLTRAGADRYNATDVVIQLRDDGIPIEFYKQTMMSMSPPAKRLERLYLSRELDHGGHPALRWCARNVAIVSDGNENIKPVKNKSTERIDGIVGLINAIGVWMDIEDDPTSVYETRGLVRMGAA